jgi:predicted nucleotidyltransferase
MPQRSPARPRDPEVVRAAVERIVGGFGPRRILLFGSQAWGSPDADSDYDLAVLVKGPADVRRMAGEIRWALRGIPASFDILVREEDVWGRWARVELTLEHRIERDGRVLYDAG